MKLRSSEEDFRAGRISLEKTVKLLEKLNIRCDGNHVKNVFKVRRYINLIFFCECHELLDREIEQ
uniref:Uncharacterized protein n=1 Tax=Monodelphis domestica TaxID=13616 RepID=A0A5F8H260_MONDO